MLLKQNRTLAAEHFVDSVDVFFGAVAAESTPFKADGVKLFNSQLARPTL